MDFGLIPKHCPTLSLLENIEPEFLIYTLSPDGKYQSEIKERLSELNSS